MGRTLNQLIDALPKRRRTRVEVRYRELKDEVEGLQQLRRAAGKAQAEIAAVLKIKQPSVSKIEKQTDLYLSTLRNYVEALGGELELIVRLPRQGAFKIRELGQVLEERAGRRATAAARGTGPSIRIAAHRPRRRARG
ncbi:MAG: XRE family transcriptional regulator [Proteobacteria bacterium]|nr:XRE family transcriptional regulator [Pseudomonadota bacterium]